MHSAARATAGRHHRRTTGDIGHNCVRTLRAALDPWMTQSGIGFDPSLGVPMETLCQKVDEHVFVAVQRCAQRLGVGTSTFALAVHNRTRCTGGVKEKFLARASFDQIPIRHAKNLHDTRQLLLLVLTREERVARIEFRDDAA